MPDDKLKLAADEIKAVLKKHDIAAIVTLASETHMEFIREIEPSWSCCRLEKYEDGFAIRVRMKQADFPSREIAKLCLEKTVGMLAGFVDVCREHQEQLTVVLVAVGKSVEFEHFTRAEGN